MVDSIRKKMLMASVLTFGAIVGFAQAASAQGSDLVEENIATVQSKVVGYVGLIAAAIVVVALAAIAIRLIPRVIRMISARIGG